jgi:phosphohistidine phosphatase SixA
MKNLFLVRYGEYADDGHLSKAGEKTMKKSAEILQNHIEGSFSIVCAAVPRAEESAAIIAGSLSAVVLSAHNELYAAEEEGKLPDAAKAKSVLESCGDSADSLIAVVSREYIETLQNAFIAKVTKPIFLERGEVLKIDIEQQSLKKF